MASSSGLNDGVGEGARHVTRLVIVARSPLHRRGLHSVLDGHDRLCVVASTGNMDQAMVAVRRWSPPVAITDLGDYRNLGLVRQLSIRAPNVRTVALSISYAEEAVIAAVEAGVAAFAELDVELGDLVRIIDDVRRIGTSFSPRAAAIMQRRLHAMALARGCSATGRLTSREFEIMSLIEDGLTNADIAQNLSIEISTVKNHVHSIFEKLDVHSRSEAVNLKRSMEG